MVGCQRGLTKTICPFFPRPPMARPAVWVWEADQLEALMQVSLARQEILCLLILNGVAQVAVLAAGHGSLAGLAGPIA